MVSLLELGIKKWELKDKMQTLHSLLQTYRRQKLLNTLLSVFCVAFLAVQIFHFFYPIDFFLHILAIFGFIVVFFMLKKMQNTEPRNLLFDLATYLDRRYPELEYSTTLLLETAPDSPFVVLQQEKIRPILTNLPRPLWENLIYKNLKINILLFSLGMFFLFVPPFKSFSFFKKQQTTEFWKKELNPILAKKNIPQPSIEGFYIKIMPPAYTQVPSSETEEPNLQVLENTQVSFQINTKNTNQITFFFQMGDSLVAKKTADHVFVLSRNFVVSDLYKIKLANEETFNESNYFAIEVQKDTPPQLTISEPKQRTKIKYGETKKLNLGLKVTDDYGIGVLQIVATVTSGKGEAVKFREMVLPFSKFLPFSRSQNLMELLDLERFGMNWGDELYFYVRASDNRKPLPNENRSEMFFVILQDTSQQIVAEAGGLAIDLVPEYFRSQRQIIIDAQKLLKIKPTISLQTFKQRSNELGFDQKALRLRYSQFLGEEFESNLVETEENDHEHEEGEDHEGEEHNEKNAEPKHGHDHSENLDPNAKPDPLEGVVHAHDSEQEATFHAPKIKATLKLALAEMWQAELHLRLYEPQKALPYCEKALAILKILQQKDRVYVRKVGFEPPPLKVLEKRLTGNLEKIYNFTAKTQIESLKNFENTRKSLAILEKIRNGFSINYLEKNTLEQAGKELAQAILEQNQNGNLANQKHLQSLSILRQVIDNKPIKAENINRLLQTFWAILPDADPQPFLETRPKNRLEEIFLEKLY